MNPWKSGTLKVDDPAPASIRTQVPAIAEGPLTCPDNCRGRRRGGQLSDLPCRYHWHALYVTPQSEFRKIQVLNALPAVDFAFTPKRERMRRYNGAIKRFNVADLAGTIFVKFWEAPNFTEMARRGIITGYLAEPTGHPAVIPGDVIACIQGLEGAAERLDALRKGDTIEMTAGPLSGYRARVARVVGDTVHWESGAIKGQTAVVDLIRLWEG